MYLERSAPGNPSMFSFSGKSEKEREREEREYDINDSGDNIDGGLAARSEARKAKEKGKTAAQIEAERDATLSSHGEDEERKKLQEARNSTGGGGGGGGGKGRKKNPIARLEEIMKRKLREQISNIGTPISKIKRPRH